VKKPSLIDPLIEAHNRRMIQHYRIERATSRWTAEQLEQLAIAIESGSITPERLQRHLQRRSEATS
jgi:hypothetical protein